MSADFDQVADSRLQARLRAETNDNCPRCNAPPAMQGTYVNSDREIETVCRRCKLTWLCNPGWPSDDRRQLDRNMRHIDRRLHGD